MDYYQFMSTDIIEQNLEFEYIELVKNQSRFMASFYFNESTYSL